MQKEGKDFYALAHEEHPDWFIDNVSESINQGGKEYENDAKARQKILQKVWSMRSNVLDFSEQGYGILYVDYDPQTNELFAGYATNAGIPKNFSIQYDNNLSLDRNLEGLVDEIFNSPVTEAKNIQEDL